MFDVTFCRIVFVTELLKCKSHFLQFDMDGRAGAVRGTAEMLRRHGDVKFFPPDAPNVVPVKR